MNSKVRMFLGRIAALAQTSDPRFLFGRKPKLPPTPAQKEVQRKAREQDDWAKARCAQIRARFPDTMTRQRRRRAEFQALCAEIKSRFDLPRAQRRKIARNQLRLARQAQPIHGGA